MFKKVLINNNMMLFVAAVVISKQVFLEVQIKEENGASKINLEW